MGREISNAMLDAVSKIRVYLTDKGVLRADVYDVDGDYVSYGKGISMKELNLLLEALYNRFSYNIENLIASNTLEIAPEVLDLYEKDRGNFAKLRIFSEEKASKIDVTTIKTITLKSDSYKDMYAIVEFNGTRSYIRIDDDKAINTLLNSFYAKGAASNLFELITKGTLKCDSKITKYYESTDGKTFTKKTVPTKTIDVIEYEVKADGTVVGVIKYDDGTTTNITKLDELNAALDVLYAAGVTSLADLMATGKVKQTGTLTADFEITDGKHITKKVLDDTDKIDVVEYDIKADGTVVGVIKYKDGTTKDLADINEVNNTFDLFYAKGFANIAELIRNNKIKPLSGLNNLVSIEQPENKHLKSRALEIEKIELDVKDDGTIVGKITYANGTSKNTSDLAEINTAIAALSTTHSKNLDDLIKDDKVKVSKKFKEKYTIKNNKTFEAMTTDQVEAAKKAKKRKIIIRSIAGTLLLAGLIFVLVRSGHPIADVKKLTNNNDDDDDLDLTPKQEGTMTVTDGISYGSSDEEALKELIAKGEANEGLDIASAPAEPVFKPAEITINSGSDDVFVQGLATDDHYINASDMGTPYKYDPDNGEYDNTEYGCVATDEMGEQIDYVTRVCTREMTRNVQLENTVDENGYLAVKTFRTMRDEVYSGKRSSKSYNDWIAKYLFEGETVINGVQLPPYYELNSYPELIITLEGQGNLIANPNYESEIGESYYTAETLGNSLDDEVNRLNSLIRDGSYGK